MRIIKPELWDINSDFLALQIHISQFWPFSHNSDLFSQKIVRYKLEIVSDKLKNVNIVHLKKKKKSQLPLLFFIPWQNQASIL